MILKPTANTLARNVLDLVLTNEACKLIPGVALEKSIQAKNKEQGKIFEQLFQKQAQRSGLLALKNPLNCRILWKSKIQIIRSELDFKLINQKGDIGFFDCKSFEDDYFTFSELSGYQIERAVLYNYWHVPAGFVVYFRKPNAICYFSGISIKQKGPGSRFAKGDGLFLGRYENFDLKGLLVR